MTTINSNGARVLTRDELLQRLQTAVRPKVKRDKFTRLCAAAIARADAVLPVNFVR